MVRLIAFTGRLLFAFLFLTSGLQKLSHFDVVTGGPEMEIMEPKMDVFLAHVEKALGVQIPLPKSAYPFLMLTAVLLELIGGILYLFGSKFGAFLLFLFMVSVTPVMHAFWDLTPDSPEQINDLISFFKNVAITGALLSFLGSG